MHPRPAEAARRGHGSAGTRPADAERLAGLLEPAVTAMGMDLEGIRITAAGRRRLLRVVVDADGGVSLDDIAKVSRELSAGSTPRGAMGETPYTLEVSSPGVDRPLTEPRHWRRAAGRLVSVPLTRHNPQGNAGHARARRTRAAPSRAESPAPASDGVTIEVDGRAREFGYAELGPGRIQIEFDSPGRLPADDDAGGQAERRTRWTLT